MDSEGITFTPDLASCSFVADINDIDILPSNATAFAHIPMFGPTYFFAITQPFWANFDEMLYGTSEDNGTIFGGVMHVTTNWLLIVGGS